MNGDKQIEGMLYGNPAIPSSTNKVLEGIGPPTSPPSMSKRWGAGELPNLERFAIIILGYDS
jgi:hypothetical protein